MWLCNFNSLNSYYKINVINSPGLKSARALSQLLLRHNVSYLITDCCVNVHAQCWHCRVTSRTFVGSSARDKMLCCDWWLMFGDWLTVLEAENVTKLWCKSVTCKRINALNGSLPDVQKWNIGPSFWTMKIHFAFYIRQKAAKKWIHASKNKIVN